MKIIKYTYTLLFAILFLSSCSESNEDNLIEQDLATLSFKVSTTRQGMSNLSDKNVLEDIENTIRTIQVFIFDSNGLPIWIPMTKEVQFDAINQQVKLSLPSTRIKNQLVKEGVSVYVLANHQLANINDEEELLSSIVENDEFLEKSKLQELIMLGSSKVHIEFVKGQARLGEILLKRLAVKIEAGYPKVSKDGILLTDGSGSTGIYYQLVAPTGVEVRLRNLYTRTFISAENSVEFSAQSIQNQQEYSLIPTDKSASFYSYSGNWRESQEGVYLEYKLKMKRVDTGSIETFYYAIPIDSKESEHKILANHHYKITPQIEIIGSADQANPKELKVKFEILDWMEQELNTTIDETHYFMLKEHQVTMSNISRYSLKFAASSKVKIKRIEEVWYWKWEIQEYGKKNLISKKEVIRPSSYEYPEIFVLDHNNPKSIEISSEIPSNFSPKYFTVVFEDEYGLEERLEVEQLPARYITGRVSLESEKEAGVYYAHDYNSNSGTQSQNNFNVYTVTTLSGGADLNGKTYKIGDPTYIKDGKVYTYEDREHNQLVSPRFVIASQRSIYDRTMYNRGYALWNRTVLSARERCANYGEAGYGVGTWRLPTEAEIEYMDAIQSDPNSPVKELFSGANYWSAASYRYYIFKRISPYETRNGMFGTQKVANSDFSNDSYDIWYGDYIEVVNQPGEPNYDGFVDPNGYDYYRKRSSKFYYSSFVRCVRDI